jgi:hypothetical protein
MQRNTYLPKENKAQIEEVREIEKETKLETPIVEKKETSKERSINEEQKEGVKQRALG